MNRESGKDGQALKRIVALLFAFAALADYAGAKPRPMRLAVLWFLRMAESIAWDFVIAVAEENGVDPDLAAPLFAYDVSDDAGRLAQSFTALAELLAGLARRSHSSIPPSRIGGLIIHLILTLWTLAPARGMPEHLLPDTS